MAVPSSAITRFELSAPFTEFDLRSNRKRFIGPKVLRPRLVGAQAASIGKIKLKQLLQSHSTKRAPKAGYQRGDFQFEPYSYATEEFGWEEPIDDRTLAIYKDIIDAEEVHAERAIDAVVQEFERDVATAIYDTAVWTGSALTTTISTPWSTHSSATPITDVHTAAEEVVAGSGLEPNALILNAVQYWNLCNCAQVVDRLKYATVATQDAMRGAIAELLGIEMILVAGGLKNTANPSATAAISRIWSNTYGMVARVATTDDPSEPCLGRTFMFSEENAGVGTEEELAVIVEEYREETVRGSVVRARNDRDIVIMYPEAGNLLINVL